MGRALGDGASGIAPPQHSPGARGGPATEATSVLARAPDPADRAVQCRRVRPRGRSPPAGLARDHPAPRPPSLRPSHAPAAGGRRRSGRSATLACAARTACAGAARCGDRRGVPDHRSRADQGRCSATSSTPTSSRRPRRSSSSFWKTPSRTVAAATPRARSPCSPPSSTSATSATRCCSCS